MYVLSVERIYYINARGVRCASGVRVCVCECRNCDVLSLRCCSVAHILMYMYINIYIFIYASIP